jgi:hypothetical protein
MRSEISKRFKEARKAKANGESFTFIPCEEDDDYGSSNNKKRFKKPK